MGIILRWLFLTLAAVILAAIIQPPLVGVFEAWGWHDKPADIPDDVVNWLSRLVGEELFPWISAGILGLAAGAWLHHFAISKDQKKKVPTLSSSLSLDFHNTLVSLKRRYSGLTGSRLYRDPNVPSDVTGMVGALFIKIEKFGIAVPDLHGCDHETYVSFVVNYLSHIKPFLATNDVAAVKRAAKDHLAI